nr:MAG TPA: hypothetical protein [Caudoviricetes sp.]
MSTWITDRTNEDVRHAAELTEKGRLNTWTEEEQDVNMDYRQDE